MDFLSSGIDKKKKDRPKTISLGDLRPPVFFARPPSCRNRKQIIVGHGVELSLIDTDKTWIITSPISGCTRVLPPLLSPSLESRPFFSPFSAQRLITHREIPGPRIEAENHRVETIVAFIDDRSLPRMRYAFSLPRYFHFATSSLRPFDHQHRPLLRGQRDRWQERGRPLQGKYQGSCLVSRFA